MTLLSLIRYICMSCDRTFIYSTLPRLAPHLRHNTRSNWQVTSNSNLLWYALCAFVFNWCTLLIVYTEIIPWCSEEQNQTARDHNGRAGRTKTKSTRRLIAQTTQTRNKVRYFILSVLTFYNSIVAPIKIFCRTGNKDRKEGRRSNWQRRRC